MHLQPKNEIYRRIGTNSIFKKKLKTNSILYYSSGINELNHLINTNKKKVYFSLTKHPDGIYISDSRGKNTIGIRFQELKNIEISKISDNEYEVLIIDNLRNKLIFNLNKKNRLSLIAFVKFLPLRFNLDVRDSNTKREEILTLKNEFEKDFISECQFNEILESSGFKNKRLTINENEIIYDDKFIDIKKVIGFSLGIEELKHYGVSRFEYSINIYSSEGHIFIRFTSISAFLKQGKHTNLLSHIGDVLFDVISRPRVATWFDIFLKDEIIDFKDFNISKYGMNIKVNKAPVIIHWDEIRAINLDLYRWPYTNTVFQTMDSSHDYRCNMLFMFIKWLQFEPSRLERLMGRTYYIN